ncbi:MAG: phosphoserine phosphatase [Coxiella sp. (in: Bacteria)]|nr:MAG: phosphoserine phosphatase [Coxiella sp. (in: g-proteobacteria)]
MLDYCTMTTHSIHVTEPINAFVFDCDCTLSFLEGIEVLATENGVGERVGELTRYAMSEVGLLPDIYQERLALVRPSRSQTIKLAQQYYASRVPEIVSLISVLQALGKAVYVVSAGINPAVKLFAGMLDVPADNVFAVDVTFTEAGDYVGFDASAYPSQLAGKRKVADLIKLKHQRLVWIGDGMNDLVVKPDVERFIGYGGAEYRHKIAENSDFYITCKSMSPALALGLTAQEATALDGEARDLLQIGMSLIEAQSLEVR